MATREEVFNVIRGERDYQDSIWNAETTTTEGVHSVTEFLVFMQDYVNEALHHVSRNGEPEASEHALHIVRKVATLGVACMEQNGALRREDY